MQKQNILIIISTSICLIIACITVIVSWEKYPTSISHAMRNPIQQQTQKEAAKQKVSEAELSDAVEIQKQATTKLTRSASIEGRFAELMKKAQRKGIVLVIVKLRVAYKSEVEIGSAAGVLAQRNAIEEARTNLLTGLSYDPATLKTFDEAPYIAMSVDTGGLEQLEASANVLDVVEDKKLKFATTDSFPQIGVKTAWAGGYNGDGKTIVILDSGVDKTHPSLTNKVVAEACFSTNAGTFTGLCPGTDKTFSDVIDSGKNCTELSGANNCGHGTHVASVAAGKTGIAFKANIISIQVASLVTDVEECGQATCLRTNTSDVMRALQYVYNNWNPANSNGKYRSYDLAAINISEISTDGISYSVNCDELGTSDGIKTYIDLLRNEAGVATIIASGNDGFRTGLAYPACISSAISVGAVGDGSADANGSNPQLDKVMDYSNVSPSLSLLAPGSSINSAVPGGGYELYGGTSLAAAHVSGAWALARQKYPFTETVWMDDSVPSGAITSSGSEAWNWVSSPTPQSGTLAHQNISGSGGQQHYFFDAPQPLQVNLGDKLFAWVYLDPANTPSQVMLQWREPERDWNHRAYWGTDNWNTGESEAYHFMGPLPEVGKWVKLEVPASVVGLERKLVYGMAFTQYGGTVTWDKAGKSALSVSDLLSRFRESQIKITDIRTGAPGTTIIPRLKLDHAMDANVPEGRWIASYYNNITLEGTPVITRDEGDSKFIDEYYTGVSPAPEAGFRSENFSARWTRYIDVNDGDHYFSVTGDDGVRLYIDDQLTPIDKWFGQGATTYNYKTHLDSGRHKITLEYFQGCCAGQLRFTWDRVDAAACLPSDDTKNNANDVWNDRWTGKYFNNANLLGLPVMVRDDEDSNPTSGSGDINFNWGESGPRDACHIFNDYFSAKWTRRAYFEAGTYKFTLSKDDGARLYIDELQRELGATNEVNVSLSAGYHNIKLEYFENTGGALINLQWAPICVFEVAQDRWKGEYFSNMSMTGSPALVRDDGNGFLNLNWGDGGPDGACMGGITDNFSVRWTRKVWFDEGPHRFTLNRDNGARLKVDGQVKIDKWVDNVETNIAIVHLTSGWHEIQLEYFENVGGALAQLSWGSAADCFEDIPSSDYWMGEYFDNNMWFGPPVMVRNDGAIGFGYDPSLSFNFGSDSPKPTCGISSNNFSARWTGSVYINSYGEYSMQLTAIGSATVYIDGDGLSAWDGSGVKYVLLYPGYVNVVIEYRKTGSNANVNFSLSYNGIP